MRTSRGYPVADSGTAISLFPKKRAFYALKAFKVHWPRAALNLGSYLYRSGLGGKSSVGKEKIFPPLRSPGFLVELGGVASLLRLSLRKAARMVVDERRVAGNPGALPPDFLSSLVASVSSCGFP
jgi:hypothetical protein